MWPVCCIVEDQCLSTWCLLHESSCCTICRHVEAKLCAVVGNKICTYGTTGQNTLTLNNVKEFLSMLSIFIVHFWVKFSVTYLLVVLLTTYDFCSNLHREGHTFYGRVLNHL